MTRISVDLVETVTPLVEERVHEAARRLPHLRYADLRVEVTEAKGAGAENGTPKFSGDDQTLALGVRVLAGDRMCAPGYAGHMLGVADVPNLARIIGQALEQAYRRASVNSEMKADAREKFGPLGQALADTRLHPVEVRQDTVGAVYRVDPRAMSLAEMVRYAVDISRQVDGVDAGVKYTYVSTRPGLSRELFVSSGGARIDQTFALPQGTCTVVTVAGGVSKIFMDASGHQGGWEFLPGGVDEPLLRFPTFLDFALGLAREGVALAAAPVLPTSDREVVVVTDPHYNTLVSHEIIGHPVELDRALKMETAYAGRSWLLGGLTEHQIGRRVASPLVTTYSDPSLPGFGHYKYDHEGTPARRVVHIDHGIFRGFMADSRDYLRTVDAVGSDFRLYPIPNCGKGQPMQTKRLGNGGPTMRSRARVVGG